MSLYILLYIALYIALYMIHDRIVHDLRLLSNKIAAAVPHRAYLDFPAVLERCTTSSTAQVDAVHATLERGRCALHDTE